MNVLYFLCRSFTKFKCMLHFPQESHEYVDMPAMNISFIRKPIIICDCDNHQHWCWQHHLWYSHIETSIKTPAYSSTCPFFNIIENSHLVVYQYNNIILWNHSSYWVVEGMQKVCNSRTLAMWYHNEILNWLKMLLHSDWQTRKHRMILQKTS
jgi:hypothetical protein